VSRTSLFGRIDPATDAGHEDPPPRKGFFTDTSVCIGCKACEVACKEWNGVPHSGLDLLGLSFDNTGALGADSWRHVAFIEQRRPPASTALLVLPADRTAATAGDGTGAPAADRTSALSVEVTAAPVGIPEAARSAPGEGTGAPVGIPEVAIPGVVSGSRADLRWLMASDVCKHCTHAACLDVCPTGSLFRTEFGTVVVQQDICNGCGYCVSACPYGVIDRRAGDGRAWKCTLCYDRLKGDLEPACAKACPTDSIQFGDLADLRRHADRRLAALHGAGVGEARLYGHDEDDGVGGDGAFFLLLDEAEVYGLPPDPVVATRDLPAMWRRAGVAALAMAAATVAAFVGGTGLRGGVGGGGTT